MAEWCKNIPLPLAYATRIALLNTTNLNRARLIAVEINKIKREEARIQIHLNNKPIAKNIHDVQVAKVALAMLCLGEASKSTRKTPFYFGNSDPKIITLFLKLLQTCFNYEKGKVRCTGQCRADQDIEALEKFWVTVTQIPKE